MYGAILGDMIGSIYEYGQLKDVHPITSQKLLTDDSFYSDDTILTIAILDAIQQNGDYEKFLKEYARRYQDYHPSYYSSFRSPFSSGFMKWVEGKKEGNSTGNGALMRISPVGYMFDDVKDVKEQAKLATIPSHNSPEAIESATTLALMIYYLRKGYSKEAVFGKLGITPNYTPFRHFNRTCGETLPNCLYAFYYSRNLEDAYFRTLQFGGDTDTNCCIVGSLAEACYGVDDSYKKDVERVLPKEFVKVLKKDNR